MGAGLRAPRIPSVRLDDGALWDEIAPELEALVRRGEFTLGSEVERFEVAAAAAFGTTWAVGTSSGTAALTVALRAALAPGSRVAVPANTFFATVEAVWAARCVPVVVDHDATYTIDVDSLACVDVDAVVPVHLYGLPADMGRIAELAAERGWFVLEDCSQAHGATVDGRAVGSLGGAGAFSAYPTKNLGAWGDAGFVTGHDPELEARLRRLRHHGQTVANVHEEMGSTDRLDALQALVLRHKLGRLPDEVAARRRVAASYREALGDVVVTPADVAGRRHAFHQFVVEVDGRDSVRAAMAEKGVGTGVHYPTPVHLQPAAAGACDVPFRPVRSEQAASRILSLPIYPSLSATEVDLVATALREALDRSSRAQTRPMPS